MWLALISNGVGVAGRRKRRLSCPGAHPLLAAGDGTGAGGGGDKAGAVLDRVLTL